MTHVVKVARPGASVSSTDPRDFGFNSKYKSFKSLELQSTTITLTTGNLIASKTIAHNLGYIPFYFIYIELEADKWVSILAHQSFEMTASPGDYFTVISYIDVNNIYVQLVSTKTFGSNQVFNIKYFVIIDDTNG